MMTRREAVLCSGAYLLGAAKQTRADEAPVRITIDRKRVEGESRLTLGVTHTRYSLDTGGDEQSIDRAKDRLADVCRYHNVHIMGWGTMNPNPAPGVYDWESLDRRMAMVRSIKGAVPVITLCAAPDWMKGGEPGKTDWSKIETAPVPEHYKDFAALAATVARHHPDVKHFQVWNEFKGFWNAPANNWNYQRYTEMYNLVYDALKAVNKGNQVGGPYLVIEGTGSGKGTGDWTTEKPIGARQWEILDYWLKHKKGAEFFVIDRGLKDFHDKNTYPVDEQMRLTRWFGDIVRQIRAKTDLPIWFAEYYASGRDTAPEVKAAMNASVLGHMLRAGTSAALLWQPMDSGEVGHALVSDARQASGGEPLPLYHVHRAFHEHFKPGTKLLAAVSSSPDVEVIASPAKTLLINKRAAPVSVSAGGRTLTLREYEVRLVDTATVTG